MSNSALVMQARLSSTRLQKKALLPLYEGVPSLLLAMEGIYGVADYHILACDLESYDVFTPIARQARFDILTGSLDDVLLRFIQVMRVIPPVKYVIRATADNTIVGRMLPQVALQRAIDSDADYFCFSQTPHGSGVEIIRYDALLEAHQKAVSSHHREHVTAYIYDNRDKFKVETPAAPNLWIGEDIRSTLDTHDDYLRLKAFWSEYYHHFDFSSIIEEYIQWARRG